MGEIDLGRKAHVAENPTQSLGQTAEVLQLLARDPGISVISVSWSVKQGLYTEGSILGVSEIP